MKVRQVDDLIPIVISKKPPNLSFASERVTPHVQHFRLSTCFFGTFLTLKNGCLVMYNKNTSHTGPIQKEKPSPG